MKKSIISQHLLHPRCGNCVSYQARPFFSAHWIGIYIDSGEILVPTECRWDNGKKPTYSMIGGTRENSECPCKTVSREISEEVGKQLIDECLSTVHLYHKKYKVYLFISLVPEDFSLRVTETMVGYNRIHVDTIDKLQSEGKIKPFFAKCYKDAYAVRGTLINRYLNNSIFNECK